MVKKSERIKEELKDELKAYQNTFGKFYPIPTLKSDKETLEKFLSFSISVSGNE